MQHDMNETSPMPNYGSGSRGLIAKSSCREASITERLQYQREELASRLADVDAALKALSENPTVADVLDQIAKLGIR